VLAAAGPPRATSDRGSKRVKDAVTVMSGGSRWARRPPGRLLITGISFIEPSSCCDDSRETREKA
jgi:hypothetical protein